MNRQFKFLMILTLFIICIVTSSLHLRPAQAATLIVPDDFPTIQAALDYASNGDTILLKAATFESNITINKSISLVGEGSPAVYGPITVLASEVQISNLSIFSGITITTSNNVKLDGNSILSNVTLDDSSSCTIVQNSGTVDRISATNSENVTISDNSIIVNSVLMNGVSGLNLSRNNSLGNISINNSTVCIIANNNCGPLWMYNSSNNNVTDNLIQGDKFGICAGLNSSNNLFDHNSISMESGEGLWIFGSSNVFNNTDLTILGSGYLQCDGPYTWNNSAIFNNINIGELLGFVLYEVSPPSTVSSYDNAWHTSDFSIDLNASDEKSGVFDTYYRISDGATLNVNSNGQPMIASEGINNTLEYWSMDNAGNEENHTLLTEIKLDKTEPTFENLYRIPDGDVEPSEDVTVAANVTDSISGVKNVELSYRTNDSTSWLNFSMTFNETNGLFEYTIPMQSLGTVVEYKISAFDYAGNEAIEDNGGKYYVYLVMPRFPSILILSPENKAYNVGNMPLTFTVDVPVSWIGYSLDGQGNMTILGNTTLADVPEGLHWIAVYANDSTGDMGASNACYFTVDIAPPVTSNNYDDSWHSTSFNITLSATDDLSGVNDTFYRINGGVIENVSSAGQPTITSEGGNNTLEYWSVDNAGNEENHRILTEIKLDETTPLIDIPSRDPAGDVQPDQLVKVSANVSDIISQVKEVTLLYNINNGTVWTPLPMNYNLSTSLYEVAIPGQSAGTLVKYRIMASDQAENTAVLAEMEPYSIYQTVPEFPSILILTSFLTIVLLAVSICKRKHSLKRSPN